jgi:RNA recognition motif-containing protein
MFYKQICYRNSNNNDLFVYKVPTTLTDEQIEKYLEFKDHSLDTGTWFEVGEVKVQKTMNKLQFVKMFPSEGQLEMITKIHNYFKAYESRQQNYVQLKAIASKMLYEKGLMFEHVRDVVGYKNHASVVHLVNDRIDIYDCEYEYENFWYIIDNGLYH